jgi:hypothetical protein
MTAVPTGQYKVSSDLDNQYGAAVEDAAIAYSAIIDQDWSNPAAQDISRRRARIVLDAANVRGLLTDLDEMRDLHDIAKNLALNAEFHLREVRATEQRVREFVDRMDQQFHPATREGFIVQRLRAVLDGKEV